MSLTKPLQIFACAWSASKFLKLLSNTNSRHSQTVFQELYFFSTELRFFTLFTSHNFPIQTIVVMYVFQSLPLPHCSPWCILATIGRLAIIMIRILYVPYLVFKTRSRLHFLVDKKQSTVHNCETMCDPRFLQKLNRLQFAQEFCTRRILESFLKFKDGSNPPTCLLWSSITFWSWRSMLYNPHACFLVQEWNYIFSCCSRKNQNHLQNAKTRLKLDFISLVYHACLSRQTNCILTHYPLCSWCNPSSLGLAAVDYSFLLLQKRSEEEEPEKRRRRRREWWM